ncbi:MAG: GNAT family N-acetyltransferase [Desulfobacterales bacterium]|nr:GNAT family N-acetyltransferase [Desulfobacterales bacterium]
MIRRARMEEAGVLTEISFASKAYWKYPRDWFDIWEKELTLTPDYIRKNQVWLLEKGGEILGYYSLVALAEDIFISGIRLPAGVWLDHMFIRPHAIGTGLGRRLFDHCADQCRGLCIDGLDILADPNARGFYEKMGCSFVKEYPSTIEGRTTPWLTFKL